MVETCRPEKGNNKEENSASVGKITTCVPVCLCVHYTWHSDCCHNLTVKAVYYVRIWECDVISSHPMTSYEGLEG